MMHNLGCTPEVDSSDLRIDTCDRPNYRTIEQERTKC